MHRARIKFGRRWGWRKIKNEVFLDPFDSSIKAAHAHHLATDPLKWSKRWWIQRCSEGRGEAKLTRSRFNRFGGLAEAERGTGPVPWSRHWREEGVGWDCSLPDHPECDKITVVTSRCFSGVITWRSSRLGINHRHLISGNTTCQYRHCDQWVISLLNVTKASSTKSMRM